MDVSGSVILDVPKCDVNGVEYNKRDWIIAEKVVRIITAMTARQLSDAVGETNYTLDCYDVMSNYSRTHTDEYDQEWYALYNVANIRSNIDWATVRTIVGDYFDRTNVFKEVSLENLSRQFDKYRLYVVDEEFDNYHKYYADVVNNRHSHKSHRSYINAYPYKRWNQIIDFMRRRWMNQEALVRKRNKLKKALDKVEVDEAKLKITTKQEWRKFISEIK